MDMYEINRRRTSRDKKRHKDHFKSIPNLNADIDYDNQYFSYTGGDYDHYNCDDGQQSRMYRSLGYIPSCDNEEYQQTSNYFSREPPKKR